MTEWIALPHDRGSMNGRPVLFVRERNAAGGPGDTVAACFMNRESQSGLLDAEAHAKMVALAPRYATFIRALFENGVTLAPHERSAALQEAMDLHTELTGEPDRYRDASDDADEGDREVGDAQAAA